MVTSIPGLGLRTVLRLRLTEPHIGRDAIAHRPGRLRALPIVEAA